MASEQELQKEAERRLIELRDYIQEQGGVHKVPVETFNEFIGLAEQLGYKKPKNKTLENVHKQLLESSPGVYGGLSKWARDPLGAFNPFNMAKTIDQNAQAGAAGAKSIPDSAHPLDKIFKAMESVRWHPWDETGAPTKQAKPQIPVPAVPGQPQIDLSMIGQPRPQSTPQIPTSGVSGAGAPGGGDYMDMIRKLAGRQDTQAADYLKSLQGIPLPEAPNMRQDYRSMMLPLLDKMPQRDYKELGDLASAYGVAQYAKPQGASLAPEAMVKANKELLNTKYDDSWKQFAELAGFAGKDVELAGKDYTNANTGYTNKTKRAEQIAGLSNPTAGLSTQAEALKFLKEEQGKDARTQATVNATLAKSSPNMLKEAVNSLEFYKQNLQDQIDNVVIKGDDADRATQEIALIDQQIAKLKSAISQSDPMVQLLGPQ